MRYILPSLLARYNVHQLVVLVFNGVLGEICVIYCLRCWLGTMYINSSYLFSMASWGKYALYTAFVAG